MDPDRRDVLTVLGLLGVGGGVSALFLAEDSGDGPVRSAESRDDPPSTETQTGEPNGYAAAVERAGSETGGTPSLRDQQTFDYDPVDVTFEDRWLSRFVASPAADGSGDTIRARPGTGSADELLRTFHRWVGISREQWGETTLADEAVSLHGGKTTGQVAVFGTVERRDLVVGARAVDEATLEAVVSAWDLPES